MSQSELNHVIDAEAVASHRKGLYMFGGATALIAILVPLAEIAINFLPGVARASQGTVTVVDWFILFRNHWFLGLRNLGLLNIVGAALLAPAILAIYSALRRGDEAHAGLSTILFFCRDGDLPRREQGLPNAFGEPPIRRCNYRCAAIFINRSRAGHAC